MTTTTPPAVLLHVAPGTLLLDRNVRREIRGDKAFVESIREHGVLVPIVAVRVVEPYGLRVRYGHRRVAAAVDAGLLTVPVFVAGDEDDDETERIIGQWVENEARAALTTGDRVGAVAQLAAFGVPAIDIARRTGASRADVAAALAVAGSKSAVRVVGRHEALTLDQAAVIADFDGDKDAIKELLDAAKNGGFDHKAQRLRDARTRRDAKDRAAAKLTAAGTVVLEEVPQITGSAPARYLSALRSTKADAGPATAMSPAEHKKCPHAAAVVTSSWDGTTNTSYLCQDWRAAGHTLVTGLSNLGGTQAELTPEQVDERKAEKRKAAEDAKAWRSATHVRTAYLMDELLPRSKATVPPALIPYVARELAAGEVSVTGDAAEGRVFVRAARLLRVVDPEPEGGDDKDWAAAKLRQSAAHAALDAAAGRNPVMAMLAVYAGAIEAEITVKQVRRAWGRYLAALAACGYELADVEADLIARCATTASPPPALEVPDGE